jgi:MFS family permease
MGRSSVVPAAIGKRSHPLFVIYTDFDEVYWLLVPFVFSTLAFGGIMVPKINLILSLICREYYSEKSRDDPSFTLIEPGLGEVDPMCRKPEVQARVAQFTLWGGLISGTLSAIVAPKLGALSDRYGRKKIMMITNAGGLSGEIITIIAANFPVNFPVYWIFVGYFVDGLCGSFVASSALVHSYATDCTPPERRNVIFGYFHACMFTGIALGPLLAALVIRLTDGVIVMFYIALACHLTFILLLIFVIPESLTKSRQRYARDKYRETQELLGPTSDWISHFRSMNLLEPLKVLYPKNDHRTPPAARRNLVLLASVDSIIFGVAVGAMTSIILYANYHFEFTAETLSYFVALVNIARVSCLLVVLPLLTRLFRGNPASRNGRPAPRTGADLFELSIVRLGIFMDVTGFIGYAFATTGTMFIASGIIASIGGIGSPTLQSTLTKHVPPDRIGQLLGAMGLLHAIGRVAGPVVFNTLYSLTVATFDRAIFIVLISLFTVAFGISWLVKPGGKLLTSYSI